MAAAKQQKQTTKNLENKQTKKSQKGNLTMFGEAGGPFG